jgi:hypothetical protein
LFSCKNILHFFGYFFQAQNTSGPPALYPFIKPAFQSTLRRKSGCKCMQRFIPCKLYFEKNSIILSLIYNSLIINIQ